MNGRLWQSPRSTASSRLALTLALFLAACEQPDKGTPENTAGKNTPAALAETPAGQSAQGASSASSEPQPSASPNADDIANLNRAMHGAAGQQPDDAPKDKYGRPYIIGNLGGVPVNLPAYSVQFVEYDDSPGFNPEKLRNYNPPTRSYDSVIQSFGFDFRNRDAQLWDINNRELVEGKTKASKEDGIDYDWAHASIRAKPEHSNPNFLDDTVAEYQDITETRALSRWEPTSEQQYGLALYIHPGNDPETGRPWREHQHAKDVFVRKASDGRVQTVIECSNRNPVNSCIHDFTAPPPFEIFINLWYRRSQLSHWQQFEENAKQIILDFRKD